MTDAGFGFPVQPASDDEEAVCPELQEFVELLPELSQEMCRERADSLRRAAERRRSRLRRFAIALAAFAMLAATFHAGQRLPPGKCREVFERIAPRTAAGLPAELAPAMLVPLAERRCEECGKRLWPLLKPGETCPHCETTDQNVAEADAEVAGEERRD